MFCKKQGHYASYKYCEDCARKNKHIKTIFYCQRCHLAIKDEHQPHNIKVFFINKPSFLRPVKEVKDILHEKLREMRQQSPEMKANINNMLSDNKYEFSQLLHQQKFDEKTIYHESLLQWLVKMEFWEGIVEPNGLQKLKTNVQKYLDEKFALIDDNFAQQNQRKKEKEYYEAKFNFIWENTPQINFEAQISSLAFESERLKKQLQIFSFYLKYFSSSTTKEHEQAFDECEGLIRKYSTCKALYLGKIRLCELLSGKNSQIVMTLDKIVKFEPQFKNSDIYYYYKAMSFWSMIDVQQIKDEMNKVFFQLKNKKYYKLTNLNEYINSLQIAISINKRPVYYSSLGIGYLIQNAYRQAIDAFEKAVDCKNDSVGLNKLWVRIKRKQTVDFDEIIRSVQNRTMHFIVNICRYFKKNKQFQHLVSCCQILIEKQPQNQNLQIQFIKAIISYSGSDHDSRQENEKKFQQLAQEQENKLQKVQIMIGQLKKGKNKQADKLLRRFKRMKSKEEMSKLKAFQKSRQTFEQIVNLGNATASDYYNYANCLFSIYLKDFDDDGLKKSLKIVNEALRLKKKVRFYKLKFFILCYLNEFNQASEILEKEINSDIDHSAYKDLIEYINDNKE